MAEARRTLSGHVTAALIFTVFVLSIDAQVTKCGNAKVDLVFVVDGSGSICSRQETDRNCQNWRNQLEFINSIVDNMDIRPGMDRVAFVQFANTGKKEFGFTEYEDKLVLEAAIAGIQHESANTNTSGGLWVMRTQLFNTAEDRPDVPNVAVVITDGKSTRDRERTIPEAEAAYQQGIKLYVVGVTDNVDEAEVRGISTYPKRINDTYWLLKSFGVLQTSLSVTQHIFEAFCNSEGTAPPSVVVPAPSNNGCPQPGSRRWQNVCFLYRATAQTWAEAEAYCNRIGGHLAALRGSSEQTYVASLMGEVRAPSVWTGGQERTDKHWRYISDGAILSGQGCYDDNDLNRDLPYKTAPIELLTPQKCVTACRDAGYTYAGVQAGLHCYCGNDFGRYGLVQGCTITCPGDSRYKCGGFQSNYIYLVNAAWGEWSENQPNNFGGKQDCVALYYTHQYKYADESCDRKYQYLCDIPDFPACSGTSNVGQYARTTPENALGESRCYFIGERQIEWWDAYADCIERGGNLVTMSTENIYLSVARMLDNTNFNRQGLYMWAGVSRKTFSWSNGEYMEYVNWAPGFPTSPTDQCIAVYSSDTYKWRDEACTKTLTYFCQWDVSPPTTSTTSTITTTLAPSTSTNTPENLQPAQNEPSLGASTGLAGSSDIIKALVALIIILIIIMIITICLLIYYNYMRRSNQVGIVDQKTRTIKYNIYEPPAYEEIDPAPTGNTAHYEPNLHPPALANYMLSKVHTEEVDNDFDVGTHVYNIQEEADRRALVNSTKKQHPDSTATDVDKKKRLSKKSRDSKHHHRKSEGGKKERDAERGQEDDAESRSRDSKTSASHSTDRY